MALARIEAEDIPLIEEQIDTGLADLLDNYRANYVPGGDRKDELAKRFTFYPSRPIPEFDHGFAKAYQANDEFNSGRAIYAMVMDNGLPYRQQAINEMIGFNHANLPTLLGAGTVNCSHLGEARQVLFVEKPAGTRLSEAMKNQPVLHEHKVIDFVLLPVVKALVAMREKKVSHGNICPATIFIGEAPCLSESYSMPCGTLAHPISQPLELMMADALGRGEASEKADVYALGILAMEMLYGLERYKALPREEFTRLLLERGSYYTFATGRDFSDLFQDFFRGVFNDNPLERWSLDQLAQWLGGKRFNMIAPPPPKEAPRPFNFAGHNYVNPRLLAHALHRQWREAVKDIKTLKLDRWCETSLHRPEIAERVERALRIAGEASNEKHVIDMMSRIIAILDPIGPLRAMSVATRPDGLGMMLAEYMRQDSPMELNQLLCFLETDIINYWSDLSEYGRTQDHSQLLLKLQRVRQFLKNRSLGFGIERALYDLNPSLPCQSDLLRQYHITNIADALKTLDALAHNLAPDTSFLDRHLTAFIASKLDMGKDIKLHDLVTIPALSKNGELIALKLLAKAQQKQDRMPLVGLSTWAAMRIEKMIDEIHNRVVRRKLKLQLKKLAATGNINDVLAAIVNRDIAMQDYDGFAHAIALHQINHNKIERFKNPRLIDYYAKTMGGRIAATISYVILAITSYVVMSDFSSL